MERTRQLLRAGFIALGGLARRAVARLAATRRTLTAVLRVRIRCLAAWMIETRRRRAVVAVAVLLPLATVLIPSAWLVRHVWFDRSHMPALEPFIRFAPPSTGVITDVRGTVLIEVAREYRRVVTYDEVPPLLRDAIVSAEDKRFFSHAGVDYAVLPRIIEKTVARSIGEWWNGGHAFRLLLPQGGSTLTQQLVRGYFLQALMSRTDRDPCFHAGLAPPRILASLIGASAANKLLRKVEEVRLALWLEEEMTRRYGSRERAKREILSRYASFIYLGNGRYGFAAAAEYYFGRRLSSFTADDAGTAAALAAIVKSPRDYAPAARNSRVLVRRNQILDLMASNGYISARRAALSSEEPIRPVRAAPLKTRAPAAIGHVLDEMARRGAGLFGIEDLFQGRVVVRSTLDSRVQAIANEALERGLAQYERRHPAAAGLVQGSVVVLGNENADVLAEVGGRRVYRNRDARYSDYNRVTGSLRQPGSAMKPLVYLAAFESGLRLDATVPDEPIEVPLGHDGASKWITNYDHQFKGPIPARQALAESCNAVAVWMMKAVGVGTVIRTAHAMGIRTPLQPYLSTALGASEVRLLELANVYRAIASGVLADPHVIGRVTDLSGETLYEASASPRTIDSDALHEIQEGLRGVVRLPDGTAHSLNSADFPIPVMGKTGSTSDFRDAWFVGSTYGPSGITVAIWIGFDDNRSLGVGETGGQAALPIFRDIMLHVYKVRGSEHAPRFPRVIENGIDQYLALLTAPAVSGSGGPAASGVR